MVLAFASFTPQVVNADTYTRSGYACMSGNNIYFAFSSTKKSTPIYKFNVKTNKRKKVYPKKSSKLKEFKNLNVLGKYIYCACRKKNDLNCRHIYRINTKNGKIKHLAKGVNPTLVGDRIVFDGTKSVKVRDNFTTMYMPSGEQFMIDKDGKSKQQPVKQEFRDNETACRGLKIATGQATFHIAKNGKKLYRTEGERKQAIFKAKKITSFRALDGYIVVKTSKGKKNYAYCVAEDGSSKKKMLTW